MCLCNFFGLLSLLLLLLFNVRFRTFFRSIFTHLLQPSRKTITIEFTIPFTALCNVCVCVCFACVYAPAQFSWLLLSFLRCVSSFLPLSSFAVVHGLPFLVFIFNCVRVRYVLLHIFFYFHFDERCGVGVSECFWFFSSFPNTKKTNPSPLEERRDARA